MFIDVDTIPAGVDWAEYIESTLERCDVLLALIGRHWLTVTDERGRRRVDDPEDFLRREISSALERPDVRVIPVCFQDAELPGADELPEDLAPLARRNAFRIDDDRWHRDVPALIDALERFKAQKSQAVEEDVPPPIRIALRYRASDVPSEVTRLRDALARQFGQDNVSFDLDTPPSGADLMVAINKAIVHCDVLLPVIGPHWLTVTDEQGRRRVDNPNDILRLEVEVALDRGVRIIPLVLHGAHMANAGGLPESVVYLWEYAWIPIDSPHQIETVIREIEEIRREKAYRAAYLEDLVMYSLSDPEAPPRRRGVRGWFRREGSPKASAPSAPDIESIPPGAAAPESPVTVMMTPPVERPSSPEQVARDTVECTVFAPRAVPRSHVAFVQVFAHLPEQAEVASALASEFDEATTRRAVRTLGVDVGRGETLTFELAMPGLSVRDSVQSLRWSGRAEAVQFEVGIPPQFNRSAVIGTVMVSRDSIPIGHVKFKLGIEDAHPSENEPVGDQAKRFALAFVSYASADRPKVIPRVQMLKTVGIECFQDILDLDPGERWEATLYRKIDECDLFLLFWSSEAKRSEWVRKEVEYAVARKGRDEFAPPEIRPVIIEGPPLVPPWEELADLHFNDRLLYLQHA